MKKRKSRHNLKKQEITLMTLLANEATKGAGDILTEYSIPKAKNHVDLENKLAELYFAPKTDKIKIEKQLAEIHPHKNWLITSLKLNTPEDVEKIKSELSEKPKDEVVEEKIKTSCYDKKCEDNNCSIHGQKQSMSNFGGNDKVILPETSEKKTINSMELIGMVGCIGLIGLTFIIVSKNLK